MGASDIIETSQKFTDQKLAELEANLNSLKLEGCAVVATGSYGRKEASLQSDLDYFVLHPDGVSPEQVSGIASQVNGIVKNVIGRLPSQNGAFGGAQRFGDLVKDIGGQDDRNDRITRRILFLIEGRAVSGAELFQDQIGQLIERYIDERISDHQLGLFFLNDLIRYYRTMCVDFEYKTVEDGKPWGIRNIKLIFSRKLIYFSGVLIAAELYQRSAKEKRETARRLFNLTPIERIREVCAFPNRILGSYSIFMEALADSNTRQMLESITRDRDTHRNEGFRKLKNEGHHFSLHLLGALKNTYPEAHPIFRALVV